MQPEGVRQDGGGGPPDPLRSPPPCAADRHWHLLWEAERDRRCEVERTLEGLILTSITMVEHIPDFVRIRHDFDGAILKARKSLAQTMTTPGATIDV